MNGDPGGIRTPDARLRTAALYPAELPDHFTIPTRVVYLESLDVQA